MSGSILASILMFTILVMLKTTACKVCQMSVLIQHCVQKKDDGGNKALSSFGLSVSLNFFCTLSVMLLF